MQSSQVIDDSYLSFSNSRLSCNASHFLSFVTSILLSFDFLSLLYPIGSLKLGSIFSSKSLCFLHLKILAQNVLLQAHFDMCLLSTLFLSSWSPCLKSFSYKINCRQKLSNHTKSLTMKDWVSDWAMILWENTFKRTYCIWARLKLALLSW